MFCSCTKIILQQVDGARGASMVRCSCTDRCWCHRSVPPTRKSHPLLFRAWCHALLNSWHTIHASNVLVCLVTATQRRDSCRSSTSKQLTSSTCVSVSSGAPLADLQIACLFTHSQASAAPQQLRVAMMGLQLQRLPQLLLLLPSALLAVVLFSPAQARVFQDGEAI